MNCATAIEAQGLALLRDRGLHQLQRRRRARRNTDARDPTPARDGTGANGPRPGRSGRAGLHRLRASRPHVPGPACICWRRFCGRRQNAPPSTESRSACRTTTTWPSHHLTLKDLLETVDHPNCKAAFDAWSPALQGENLAEAALKMAPLTVHTTVADYQKRPRFRYQPQLVNYEAADALGTGRGDGAGVHRLSSVSEEPARWRIPGPGCLRNVLALTRGRWDGESRPSREGLHQVSGRCLGGARSL